VFSLKLATDRNLRPSCREDGSLHWQPKMNSRLSVGLSSGAISSLAQAIGSPHHQEGILPESEGAKTVAPVETPSLSCYLIRFF
jgi:hypothetical protein